MKKTFKKLKNKWNLHLKNAKARKFKQAKNEKETDSERKEINYIINWKKKVKQTKQHNFNATKNNKQHT